MDRVRLAEQSCAVLCSSLQMASVFTLVHYVVNLSKSAVLFRGWKLSRDKIGRSLTVALRLRAQVQGGEEVRRSCQ